MFEIEHKDEKLPRALLVGVDLGMDRDFLHSMEELRNLTEACDMEPAGSVVQSASGINPATYIGSGKLLEIQEQVELEKIEYVIFEDTLSPAQLKNIQKVITAQVMDRTNLILEIFSKRARTRESRLQVEYANLQYLLPRLVGMWTHLERQGGASGSMSNKGVGETQIELDRRHIEKRIAQLRRELEEIEHNRDTQRSRRSRSDIPSVALVGYTNAGKSTLMNLLIKTSGGSEEKAVMAKNMLFATLDTTVRRISTGDRKDFLLSDTVGFISKLPHSLVQAFRSTLDEVRYADLLVEVVDVSDDHYREQMQVTAQTLKELGAETIPCIHVMNKADLIPGNTLIPRVEQDRIYMSAGQEIGLEELLKMIRDRVYAGNHTETFLIPYTDGGAVNDLCSHAKVESMEYLEEGIRIVADCRVNELGKYEKYIQ